MVSQVWLRCLVEKVSVNEPSLQPVLLVTVSAQQELAVAQRELVLAQ